LVFCFLTKKNEKQDSVTQEDVVLTDYVISLPLFIYNEKMGKRGGEHLPKLAHFSLMINNNNSPIIIQNGLLIIRIIN
jgi:hypothetical protein